MSRRRSLIIAAAIALTAVFATPNSPAGGAPKPPPPPLPGPVTVTAYADVADPAANPAEANTYGVTGVNDSGVVVGNYGFGLYNAHGFIEDANGFVTIDVGAPGTVAMSINNAGTVVGRYFTWPDGVDRPPVDHGFIRDAATGAITVVDDPALTSSATGAVGVVSYGTVATGINSSGVVVGYSYIIGPDTFAYPPDEFGNVVVEAVTHNHGFIRSSTGVFRTYDAPAAARTGGVHVGTRLTGINTAGTMVGAYTYLKGTQGGVMPMDAGFVVSGKKFTRIVDPNPDNGTGSCSWHEPNAINDAGVIVGNSGNACGGFREAWALSGGVFTYLSYPCPDPPPWVVDPEDPRVPLTIAGGINNAGVVGGQWGDGRMKGWSHGFTATFTTATFTTAATG